MKFNATFRAILIAVPLLLSFHLKAQNISTLAGGGSMDMPWAIAADASFIYTADYSANRVFKINISNGTVTTIAGTGTYGFNGDGIAATSAHLNSPTSVAVDAAGNVYIADAGNNRIRKITAATGIISTVAGTGAYNFSGDGGLATAATLRDPFSVALDAAENIYIADYSNHRIRKITKATGIINTIAGTNTAAHGGDGGLATAATFYYPQFVTTDVHNNIYIADLSNRVRKITAATGIINTIAGTGAYAFSGDGGQATNAGIKSVGGIDIDGEGNVYIADGDNNRIRKINTSGVISTVVGTGASGDGGNGGLASNATLNIPQGVLLHGGNMYIANTGAGTIRKVSNAYIVLPVKLSSFTAEKRGKNVLLQWRSLSEINNAYFNIEHSKDGVNFTAIGRVNASGSGSNYSFTHTQPAGKNFYRLAQTDNDGQTSYSNILSVATQWSPANVSVYPNPATGNSVMLDLSDDVTEVVNYYLVDLLGKTVQKGTINNRYHQLNLSGIAKGKYILQLSTGQSQIFSRQ